MSAWEGASLEVVSQEHTVESPPPSPTPRSSLTLPCMDYLPELPMKVGSETMENTETLWSPRRPELKCLWVLVKSHTGRSLKTPSELSILSTESLSYPLLLAISKKKKSICPFFLTFFSEDICVCVCVFE